MGRNFLHHVLFYTQGMEDLVAKGLVKAIGISNFTILKTDNLLKTAKTVPAINQGRCGSSLFSASL